APTGDTRGAADKGPEDRPSWPVFWIRWVASGGTSRGGGGGTLWNSIEHELTVLDPAPAIAHRERMDPADSPAVAEHLAVPGHLQEERPFFTNTTVPVTGS